MSRVLLEFDARANQAEKEIKKLQKQMAKMGDAPKKATKEMGSLDKAAQGFAGTLGGIVGVGAIVGSMIKDWKDDINLAAQSAKNLTNILRGTLAGVGLAHRTEAIGQEIKSRQKAGTLTMGEDAINQVTGAFLGAFPTASEDQYLDSLELGQKFFQEYGHQPGATAGIMRNVGTMMRSGFTQEQSAQLAHTASTVLGDAAPQAIQAMRLRAFEVGPEQAFSERSTAFAIADAGARGMALQQLQQYYESLGGEARYGSFNAFVENVNESELPPGRPRQILRQVRGAMPGVAAAVAASSAQFPALGGTYGQRTQELAQEGQAARASVEGNIDLLYSAELDAETEISRKERLESGFFGRTMRGLLSPVIDDAGWADIRIKARRAEYDMVESMLRRQAAVEPIFGRQAAQTVVIDNPMKTVRAPGDL